LTKVFKKQKGGAATASSTAAAATAAASFRRRLQRYCSEMGAKFVDYQADDGIWIFEVGVKVCCHNCVMTDIMFCYVYIFKN
jgi:hypothetical protein